MIRLLLRISLGILVASFATIVVTHLVFRSAAIRKMETSPPPLLAGVIESIQKHIDGVPDDRLLLELNRLSTRFNCPVSIVGIDSEKISPDVVSRLLSGGRKGQISIRNEEFFVYLPTRKQKVLIIGPMSGMPVLSLANITMVLVSAILIVGLTGFLLSAHMVRRIKKLEQAAVRISAGELHARANVESKDAIGNLARQFNVMANRNQNLLENQRRLLQAVSHELRTPTARIRFGLEMLFRASTEDEKDQRIQSLDDDLTEIDELVQELLVFNRLDVDSPPLNTTTFSAGQAIKDVVDHLQHLRTEIQVEIEDKVDSSWEVHADPKMFKRAIRNLLSNALRYAKKQVTIICCRGENAIIVEIFDDGPGVPSSERIRVFEPFTRMDKSRSRGSGGAGLGLAIVQRIMKAHHGSVEISDSDGGGTHVVTRWPTAQQSSSGTAAKDST
jgi:two-component system sensor histidine kinase RstB